MNAINSLAAHAIAAGATADLIKNLQARAIMGYDSPVTSVIGFDGPVSTGATTAPPQKVRGFSISNPSCAGHDPFMAGRVGHSQECAGSCTRSVNLHGLPPILDGVGGSFKAVVQESIMTESLASTGATAVSTFTPELSNTGGHITTTSIQVAQHFGKTHKSVLRAIRNLECSAEYRERNFAPTTIEVNISGAINAIGATRLDPAYRLTRDGFVFLAMGFTGKEAAQWKEAYITAFNKMEAELTTKLEAEPRIAYSVNPTDTLTASQAEQIRLIFKDKCDTLPQAEQAGFMTKGWSKMKSHFGVTYRKIEQREFSEAVSLATRHAAEWRAVGAVVATPVKNAPKALPVGQPTTTLQLMLVTTCSGASTVELLPASDLPQLIMHKDGVFTTEQALKIAVHANLRMMGETIKVKSSSPLERLRSSISKLSPSELLEFTIDGWSELAMRTALTNEMGGAA